MEMRGAYDALENGQLIGPFSSEAEASNVKNEIDKMKHDNESDDEDDESNEEDKIFVSFIFQQKPKSELNVLDL